MLFVVAPLLDTELGQRIPQGHEAAFHTALTPNTIHLGPLVRFNEEVHTLSHARAVASTPTVMV